MIQVQSDPATNLITFRFHGRVTPDEARRHVDDARVELARLKAGFQLLTDLSGLDSMDVECAPHIERVMETADRHGVSRIVRVIPDPSKDIGLSILSLFH